MGTASEFQILDSDHPRGYGRTHAKMILLGEHSVVYGKPAIAFPVHSLHLRAEAEFRGRGWQLITPFYAGEVTKEPEGSQPLERILAETAVRNTLRLLGSEPTNLHVTVTGYIPPARGLGSSAAVAGAISLAVARLHGVELSSEQRFHLVQSVERVAHGTPSGLDAYATTRGTPIWFHEGIATPLALDTVPRLLVADTGIQGHTAEAVSKVRRRFESDEAAVTDLLTDAERIAREGRDALQLGQISELGSLMNEAHAVLNALGVGDRRLDVLVEAALRAGAAGAKLTGGGMGGCMIALAPDAHTEMQLVQALTQVGATAVWPVHDGGDA